MIVTVPCDGWVACVIVSVSPTSGFTALSLVRRASEVHVMPVETETMSPTAVGLWFRYTVKVTVTVLPSAVPSFAWYVNESDPR